MEARSRKAVRFAYEQKVVRAIKEHGLLVAMNLMGWIEPRLPYSRQLKLDSLQVEASLRGYTDDLGLIRKALGEEACLLGNSHSIEMIELGDEGTWRRATLEQARRGSPASLCHQCQHRRDLGRHAREVPAFRRVQPQGLVNPRPILGHSSFLTAD